MSTTEDTEVVATSDPGAPIAAARITMPGYDTQLGPVGHLADPHHDGGAGIEWGVHSVKKPPSGWRISPVK